MNSTASQISEKWGGASLKALLVLSILLLPSCAAFSPPKPYMPNRAGIQQGETITVKPNENVYAIAREHNVSMRDLIVLNNLKPPYEVRTGQSLDLPVGAAGVDNFTGDMPVPQAAPLGGVEKSQLAPIEPAAVSSQSLAPLSSGAVAPAAPSSSATSPPRSGLTPFGVGPSVPAPQPQAMPPAQTQTSPQSLSQPVPLVPDTKPVATTQAEPVQALNRSTPAPKPVATTSSQIVSAEPPAALAWPVQGPILSTYGSKSPGLNNDGINISAPKGAPVIASGAGTVVYAGNEMKGFGNLVLIRHEGDWVTAYAHLDRVLVKKDSIVAQGDMIGTIGKTGNVSTPQLHFETRHMGKPVDPSQVIKDKP